MPGQWLVCVTLGHPSEGQTEGATHSINFSLSREARSLQPCSLHTDRGLTSSLPTALRVLCMSEPIPGPGWLLLRVVA
jgi:hypothetical protein